jgi:Glycosyl hydrolases family 28
MKFSFLRDGVTFFVICCLINLTSGARCQEKTDGVFNVKNYGATGDGLTLDTPAINLAIQACKQAGGGLVVFPTGRYVTGTFEVFSHMTLEVESGAVILASTNLADYGLKEKYGIIENQIGQSGEGVRAGIVVVNHAEDVAIVGHGVFDGRGTYFVDLKVPHVGSSSDFDKQLTRQGQDFALIKSGIGDGPVLPWMPWTNRPGVLITVANSTNVLLRDVTIKDSHNWTINIGRCENVVVSGITILNNPLIPNNDGIDISARNARLSDCNIIAGDDAIAANRCENLTVANCTLSSRSSGIRFGSNTNCVFQNIVISDSNRGIAIYGSADTAWFSNINIQTRLFNGQWWGKGEPIYISVSPDANGSAQIKNIHFSNIDADSESGIMIYGTAASIIHDLSFDRIKLRLHGGVNSRSIGGNFDLRGLGGGVTTAIFKHDIPGIYAQYVDGLQIHGFEVEWGNELPEYFSDGIHCEHFDDLIIDGFKGRPAQNNGSTSAIVLQSGRQVSIRNCEALAGTGTFLLLEDVQDQRLFINNDLTNAQRPTNPAKTDFKVWTGNALVER